MATESPNAEVCQLSYDYLSASFVNVLPEDLSEAMDNLGAVASHLVWLNLDYQNLEDEMWARLSMLTNLRKLSARSSNQHSADS